LSVVATIGTGCSESKKCVCVRQPSRKYFTRDKAAFSGRVADDLRDQYILAFEPAKTDAEFHEIRVVTREQRTARAGAEWIRLGGAHRQGLRASGSFGGGTRGVNARGLCVVVQHVKIVSLYL
jgi:hypothetical protein